MLMGSRPSQLSVRLSCMEAFLSKLRAYLAIAFAGLSMLIGDPIQRFLISGIVTVLPSKKDAVLGWWQRCVAHSLLFAACRIGGARLSELPRIPARAGVLILMNHQSLLDIPVVVLSMDKLYPRIVTRALYARRKPLMTHMAKLYQYPLVDPRAPSKEHLLGLEKAAREGNTPLVLFPEGTRSRNGEIGRWRRGALDRLLRARSWKVYMIVIDGFWQVGKLSDFVANVSSVRGNVTSVGPFDSPKLGEPLDAFVEEMKTRMHEALTTLRASRPS